MRTVQDILNPDGDDHQDSFTAWMRSEGGFVGAKRLPDRQYAGVLPLIFTYAICIGVTPASPFVKRYCYDDSTTMLHEFEKLSSIEDNPVGWIAKRPANY